MQGRRPCFFTVRARPAGVLTAEPANATGKVSVLQADRGRGSRQEAQLRELQAQLVAKAREVRVMMCAA